METKQAKVTVTMPDGSIYEGEIDKAKWRDGAKHGPGVLTEPDGGRYEGEFRDGEPHGDGQPVKDEEAGE